MSLYPAIVGLLQAGHSNKAIGRQLQINQRRVQAVREELGLPTHKPGMAPSSAEDLFWRRAVHTDDGHLLWPGTSGRVHGGPDGTRPYVTHVAFRIRHGRDPIGKAIAGCDTTGCIHPAHVEDQPMRDQYRAIFGEVTA
ncbi:hypothetical protein ACFCX0_03755 [Streptomyces sp. NPDC056352]|uniref:hypothetical protein n=1 Tax=Streptomyces sp. NPDC056352 TaxID=3345791 RepID=UPI0035DDAF98